MNTTINNLLNPLRTFRYLFLLVFFSPGHIALSQRLEVCPDCKWTSVKKAIEVAKAGDTVVVKAGVYREHSIEISKPLVLLGQAWPIIDGNHEGEILIVRADGTEIRGLQLQNVGVSYLEDRAAIRLVACRDVLIEGNRLRNTFFGIYLQKSVDCIIRRNEIIGSAAEEYSSGNAIHVWKATHIVVEHNVVKGHRDGIYFEFVDSSRIVGNLSENNLRYGLHFMFSNHDDYRMNTFRDNGVGVAVMFSKHIKMIRNLFEDNWGPTAYGILLKEISDGELIYNTFRNNTRGVYAEGTNRLQISHNDFVENGWAVDIKGNCVNNRFECNNFIDNTFEVITNSKQSSNTFLANYWSHYQGYDLDRDGFGDIPHRPVSLFALLVDEVPAGSILLYSFLQEMMEFSEKAFPTVIPDKLVDSKPVMKPYPHDKD